MDPEFLGLLTRIAVNKKSYKPSWEHIKDAYFAKYRGQTQDEDELPAPHAGAAGCSTDPL